MAGNTISTSQAAYASLLPKKNAADCRYSPPAAKLSSAGLSGVDAISHTYTYREGKADVREIHYEVPKGQHSNLVGSYSYRTESMKAGRLKTRIALEKSRLRDVEKKAPKKSRAAAKASEKIRGRVRKLQRELDNEIASSPITRIVVHEREEEPSPEDLGYEVELSLQKPEETPDAGPEEE